MGPHAYPSQPYPAFSPYAHPMHTHNPYVGQPPVQPYPVPTVAPKEADAQQPKGYYLGRIQAKLL